ncbi:glycosyltransferase [Vibrio sp. MA40-2]|uniref:glycosyltransferase n=1 Tax=Vibrio sp. MA40-2 TaxID=3391828 RepID=UPI0039A494D7
MHNDKIHVCHLVYCFDVGGLERVVLNCINNLPSDKFRHTIISLTNVGAFITELPQSVEYHSLNKKSGNDPSIYFKLYRLLNQIKPDVLHSYNLATIEYQWVALLARVKLRVHAEHGRDTYDPNGSVKKYQFIRRFCSHAIHRIISVSGDLDDWLSTDVKIPKNKLRLIKNGIDTHYFDRSCVEVEQRENPFKDKFVIGHVARLHGIKNQMLLLKSYELACRQSADFNRDSVLVIVGDGPDREMLENYVSNSNVITENVHFEGARNNVHDYYKLFDVFAMSSIAEGIPMTLLESMSMSIPHLVTLVGGIGEVVIQGKTGLAVESNDDSGFCLGLIELYSNTELRDKMAVDARKRIVSEFNQQIMMDQYTSIYLRKN